MALKFLLVAGLAVFSVLLGNACCDEIPDHFMRHVYPDVGAILPIVRDLGSPLILTPYIESGNLDEAKSLAAVNASALGWDADLVSYSGFITVNETHNSNTYFWFFPATEVDSSEAPVLVWLQGGPGGSSLFGLFVENGPFGVDRNMDLYANDYSWSRFSNLLFIDNPVGTGFSFTDGEAGYAKNEEQIGSDLYEFLLQFFTLFSEYQTNEFYVSGESYAGKYVPAIAYKIYKENPTAALTINLKGIAIGDGYTDPFRMMDYSDFLYNVGFLDDNERDQMEYYQLIAKEYILAKDWLRANTASNKILSYFQDLSGFRNMYDYTVPREPMNQHLYAIYVQLPRIRSALNVGNQSFHGLSERVYVYLLEDMCQSVTPWVEELLANSDYRIMFYNGMLDIICGNTLTQNLLGNLLWDGREEFLTSSRTIWWVDDDVAGYVRQAGNLMHVSVRNAGHMVPYDQPAFGYDMMYRFVNDAIF